MRPPARAGTSPADTPATARLRNSPTEQTPHTRGCTVLIEYATRPPPARAGMYPVDQLLHAGFTGSTHPARAGVHRIEGRR